MFNWFRPTCPVDPDAKEWVEARLHWLADQFGLDVFTRRAIILPTIDFFPDHYDASYESIRCLLDRVCMYMDADPKQVHLELFTNDNDLWLVNEGGQYLPKNAGLYEQGDYQTVIHLETSQLDEPLDLVGTMAHELAHLRLLGENRLYGDEFDNELLTDLTVVFHGMGIFLANSPRAWESDFSYWPGTKNKRPEYMTLQMFGYAIAHTAWHRNAPKPEWSKHLRMDARSVFKQGVRFLTETGNSQFKPHANGLG